MLPEVGMSYLMLAIITVRQFPPSESFSKRVSFESLRRTRRGRVRDRIL